MSVNINALKGSDWQLQNTQLTLSHVGLLDPTLEFKADGLILPSPFEKLRLINLRCKAFTIRDQKLQCQNGVAELKLEGVIIKPFNFSFLITEGRGELHVNDLQLAQGRITISMVEQHGHWQVASDGRGLALSELKRLFNLKQISVKQGRISAQLKLDGENVTLANAALDLQVNAATLQAGEGRYALENATLESYLHAQPLANEWAWQSHVVFKQGALYIDPIYLDAPKRPLEVDTVGQWSPQQQRWQVDYFQIIHPSVATLNGEATLSPANPKWLSTARLNLQAQDLKTFSTLYNSPFWVGSAFENVTFAGQLWTTLGFTQNTLTTLDVDVEQLSLLDPKQRFGLLGGKAVIRWAEQPDFKQQGFVQWEQLQVYKLPLGKVRLNLDIEDKVVTLRQPVKIPFLGGDFDVNQFAWQARSADAPDLHFAGGLHNASLAQLTRALDWTPLTGTISGAIPGMRYQHRRLDLEGALTVQVFDGEVIFKELAVANLLSDVPKFYSDIDINRLNLEQLTGEFKFGSIKGLLSGFVHELYLENWQPISFYAWLGTPDNDETSHRISQKAVDNIANIGGNGATDMLSRSVLGVFDSFGYDKLGMGCYLHDGVCQLMGVSAAKNGYYLIKGGGIPRIDVVGYNPRVDWAVLLQRLARIGKPNDMVIK